MNRVLCRVKDAWLKWRIDVCHKSAGTAEKEWALQFDSFANMMSVFKLVWQSNEDPRCNSEKRLSDCVSEATENYCNR